MFQPIARLSLVALVLGGVAARPAFAHGGTYGGPGDTVPKEPEGAPPGGGGGGGGGGYGGPGGTPGAPGAPGGGGPPSTPAPSGPSKPSSPGPSGPGSPGPGLPGLGGPWGGGPSAPPRPVTPGLPGGELSLAATESWHFWWTLTRDPWLDVAGHARGHELASDGRTSSRGLVGSRPLPAVVFGEVVPVLVALLERDEPAEVTAATLIALARIAEDLPSDEREAYLPRIAAFLSDGNVEVAEAALIAVGVLGAPSGMPLLASVVRGDDSGRDAIGRRVPARRRALAAEALALCARRADHEDARRYAVSVLSRVLADDEPQELHAACVVALGLVPTARDAARYAAGAPTERRGAALVAADVGRVVDLLAEVMVDEDRPALVRAQAPIALVRLVLGREDESSRGAPAAIGEATDADDGGLRARVLELLTKPLHPRADEPRELERAAVIALGLLADADGDAADRTARTALEGYARDSRDGYGSRRAWIALARASARAGRPDEDGGHAASLETLTQTRRTLLVALGRARGEDEVWLSLAVGVLEHEAVAAGRDPSYPAQRALKDLLGSSRNAEKSAAFATALGLARVADAGELCAKLLERSGDTRLRGALALALGMIRDAARADALIGVIVGASYRPEELTEAALGLALLGDRRAVDVLSESLANARSLSSQAAFATALGQVGDARAVAPLLGMIGDEARTDRARAFAAAALGGICDRDPLPWNTELKLGVNPTALPETLVDASGFGILNLL